VTEGRRETASVTTRFKIRYRTDIEPSMTVHLGTDVYNIASVLDFDGTQRELTLNCRKVINS
jgi:SPP1 family predicted phage head-tail adaptor